MRNLRPERGGRGGAYWFAVWNDASGRRRRKSLGPKVKSRAAARRACNDLLAKAAADDGFAIPGRPPALVHWLRTHLQHKTAYAPTTAKLYRQAVAELAKWRGDAIVAVEDLETTDAKTARGITRLDTLTREDAASFRHHLSSTRSETTTRKIIRTLRTLYGEAVKQDIVGLNPWDRQAVTTPAVDKVWDYTSDEDFARVLYACPDAAWRVFFAIPRYAGLRLNETCRLSFGDVDWDARQLRVVNPRGHHTTKHRARVVPIVPELHHLLLDRFEQASPGESVTGMAYAKFNGSSGPGRLALNGILKRAAAPRATPHNLRRSCETDWLKSFPAPDVCKWLGNSIAVAMQHYHQTTAETMAKVTGTGGDAARIAELEAELEKLRGAKT